MCNLYGSTKLEGIRRHWQPSVADHLVWEGGVVAPRKPGASAAHATMPGIHASWSWDVGV
jgi:hypothetical protein